jgi:hypothetical protein
MKTFIVLGMHRSATALTSKALNEYIYMGDDILPVVFENRKFLHLNSKILKKAGGSWRNPPPEKNILKLAKHFNKEIKNTLAEESEKARFSSGNGRADYLWGWKDPRSVLTIRLFLPYLENPHFICHFRNPIDIANSLARRKSEKYKDLEMTYEEGLKLVNIYNKRLLDFLRYLVKSNKNWPIISH